MVWVAKLDTEDPHLFADCATNIHSLAGEKNTCSHQCEAMKAVDSGFALSSLEFQPLKNGVETLNHQGFWQYLAIDLGLFLSCNGWYLWWTPLIDCGKIPLTSHVVDMSQHEKIHQAIMIYDLSMFIQVGHQSKLSNHEPRIPLSYTP